MASSINASTTAGVVTTADTSAILQLQTGGTTAISIDASQAVSFTNAPTVTGGTANGVAFLNGSKVLTTGSALSFDGSVLATSVSGSTALTITSSASQAYINLRSVATAGFEPFIGFGDASAGNIGQMLGINGGGLRWTTAGTERMRLNASGQLILGDTTADGRLKVVETAAGAGVTFYNSANNSAGQIGTTNEAGAANSLEINAYRGSGRIVFKTNNTYAASIDTSGNLLVGTTSNPAGVRLVIGGTSSNARIVPATDNVGYVGEGSYRWQAIFAVNGTIQTSDGREKNTIEDSNLGLSFVNALRPVSYKWNVGENVVTYDEEGKEVVTPRAGVRVHYGFIAQEVKAAIPEGVDFGGFVQEPDEGRMSLRYHEFIGPLVKAIQEQQALITQLQADVAALKGA